MILNFWNEYATFISSSEAKNAYFMTGASRDEKKWHIYSKNWNYLFIIYTILRFFARNDVIHVCTLCHINDDVA